MEASSTDEYAPSEYETGSAPTNDHSREDSVPEGSTGETRALRSSSSSSWPATRKRKRQSSYAEAKPSTAVLLQAYNDGYRELLNIEIEAALSSVDDLGDLPLQPSQIGLTFWTSEEKAVFFTSLSRKGRHNIHGIANDIKTKSESEVQVYLQLLRQALVDQNLQERRQDLLSYADIPAAVEIDPSCELELNLAAEALEYKVQNYELRIAEKKYGDILVIDDEAASLLDLEAMDTLEAKAEVEADEAGDGVSAGSSNEAIEPSTKDKDDTPTEKLDELLSTTALFNMRRMLELSARMFMSTGQRDQDWQTYAEEDASPSINLTALSDLRNLVVSLLRRLIASSIFIANSRVRAASISSYTPKAYIWKADVRAALEVLDMPANSHLFWVQAARRCKLSVYERFKNGQAFGPRLEYDFVESRLTMPSSRSSSIGPSSACESSVQSEDEDSENGVSTSCTVHDKDRPSKAEPGVKPGTSAMDSNLSLSMRGEERRQDAYAEWMDERASRHEQQRLWTILGKNPPEALGHAAEEVPDRPQTMRKSREELADWMDWLEWMPPWQRYSEPVDPTIFAAKRRRSSPQGRSAFSVGESANSDGSLLNGADEAKEEEGSTDNTALTIRSPDSTLIPEASDAVSSPTDDLVD